MLTRALAIVLTGVVASQMSAQSCVRANAPILVGSEWEQYVRTLQIAGAVELQPWTLRAFGEKQSTRLTPQDTALPWAGLTPEFARSVCLSRVGAFILSPHAQLIHNSGFPVSYNDGAIWAGRGLTIAADAGAGIVLGPLSVTIAPVVFASQNVRFTTKSNGLTDRRQFADWRNPQFIDLPQRFGSEAYSQFDAGQSTIRLDLPVVTIGATTANQFFGPAYEHPLILGNNAAGFPQLFAGTSAPFRIWKLGAVHGRVFWGQLGESAYSPLADSSVSRLASGIVGVFQPNGAPGLEIGGARFFHVLQQRFDLNRDEILRPFGAFLLVARARQTGSLNEEPDNQLSSVFARWVLPRSGLEVYGEFGREDRNFDFRESVYFLDHDSGYLLGARKVWRRDDIGRLRSLRAEVLNTRVTHLALSSNQSPWYIHGRVTQGHTHRGQALGSASGYGGGGSVLVFEQYDRRGRWRVEWNRFQFAESRTVAAPDLFNADVAHTVGGSMLRFGHRVDLDFGITGIYEFNRYLEKDALSLRTQLSVRQAARHSR